MHGQFLVVVADGKFPMGQNPDPGQNGTKTIPHFAQDASSRGRTNTRGAARGVMKSGGAQQDEMETVYGCPDYFSDEETAEDYRLGVFGEDA